VSPSGTAGDWRASIRVRVADRASAVRLHAALSPEVAREVPRVTATVRWTGDGRLELVFVASETGALRAALNTYLGWIRLAEEVERAAALNPP
jgi:tRNA threonylcarbamoyladenosine modification (KEOPS) complex  Pcc1 subunit